VADQPVGDGRVKELTLTAVRPGRGEAIDPDLNFDPSLAVGEVIAGRYEVEAFLAKGGMGEVYRVLDRELGETVALKTILPQSLKDPVAMDRFRREIQIARKVSHPNVCRIFDLGRHEREETDDVVFFTMELLSGHSLRARLLDGPMGTDEARSVVEQLCAGLGAAHQKGIIHRDLKPSNIFLVPEDEGFRVVIADFGLARVEIKEDDDLSVTRTGEILGTPAYMSPEQLEGKEATAGSDIYALGLVIFEILTGSRPFEGASAFQVALNKLRETPSTPSSQVNDLPRKWDYTVLRCLEPDPDDRFGSVTEIQDALAGPNGAGPSRFGSRWRQIGFLVAGLMLVVAVVLVGAKLASRPQHREEPVSGAGQTPEQVAVAVTDLRDSVAILGFENITGNPAAAGVSDELRELLSERFEAGGELLVVPAEEVRTARTALAIDRVSTLGPESLVALKERLDVDLVVLGSCAVFTDEGSIRLDARIQDIEAGEIILVPSVHGPVSDLESVADNAVQAIRHVLGFSESDALAGE